MGKVVIRLNAKELMKASIDKDIKNDTQLSRAIGAMKKEKVLSGL